MPAFGFVPWFAFFRRALIFFLSVRFDIRPAYPSSIRPPQRALPVGRYAGAMTEPTPVTFDELVWAADLRAVDLVEIAGRRRAAEDPMHAGGPETRFDVGATRRAETIIVTCGVDVETTDAVFRVRAQAVFVTAEPIEIDGEVMRSFVEQVGLTTLHPFLRATVRDLSGRLGVVPTVMGLLQPGQIQIGLTGTERHSPES